MNAGQVSAMYLFYCLVVSQMRSLIGKRNPDLDLMSEVVKYQILWLTKSKIPMVRA